MKSVYAGGFNVQDFSSNWDGIPAEYMNDYTPTSEDTALITERIKRNIVEGKRDLYHYYKEKYNRQGIINRLYK